MIVPVTGIKSASFSLDNDTINYKLLGWALLPIGYHSFLGLNDRLEKK
jgi:hypothetical protein